MEALLNFTIALHFCCVLKQYLNGKNLHRFIYFLLQIVIGKPKNRAPTGQQQTDLPVTGQFCLAELAKYDGIVPLVGKVVNVERNITVHWHYRQHGMYKGSMGPVKGQRGKREPKLEQIPLEAIYFHSFNLTKSGYLPKIATDAMKEHLNS